MYGITYRCRMCNKLFTTGVTNNIEVVANMRENIVANTWENAGNPISPIDYHECKPGENIGFGDIVGFTYLKDQEQQS